MVLDHVCEIAVTNPKGQPILQLLQAFKMSLLQSLYTMADLIWSPLWSSPDHGDLKVVHDERKVLRSIRN